MEPSALKNNKQVSAILYEISDLLKAKGVQFKPQAYAKAARAIDELQEDIAEISGRGALEEIPGVGTHIAAKIREILKTGRLNYLENLRQDMPRGVREIAEVEGIGPKRSQVLIKELGITSISQLEEAASAGRIRDLPGFGELSEKKILTILKARRQAGTRYLLGDILPVAEEIVKQLVREPAMHRISLAGSLRRKKETIGDVDILATSPAPEKVMEAFCTLAGIGRVIERGPTRSSVVLKSGLQVDLRVVDEEQYGAALLYFTGSKDYNIALRRRALARNAKLNEYGLFDRSTDKILAGRDEQEMFQAIGLPFMEPELRENRGEIEAAESGTLPDIIPYGTVKGDLHVHTTWSDGKNGIKEMAAAALSLGYEYIAICDHAKSQQVTRGLDKHEIARQQVEIEQVNRTLDGITVLAGIECGINESGSLDMSSTVLKDLDIVIAGVHDGLDMKERDMTTRLVTALHNDSLDILAHPTGRILLKREPAPFDLLAVAKAAQSLGVILEINAYPSRLDLPDTSCMLARAFGTKFAISSDAHRKEDLHAMDLGVATARRGWLAAKEIVNTLPLRDLRAVLNA